MHSRVRQLAHDKSEGFFKVFKVFALKYCTKSGVNHCCGSNDVISNSLILLKKQEVNKRLNILLFVNILLKTKTKRTERGS